MLGQQNAAAIARAATQPKFAVNWAKMPPKLLKAISKGLMPTEGERRLFIQRIVEDVRHKVPFAERAIFESIADKIHTKFPTSFSDIVIRSKLKKPVSLTKQLKDCFDNSRRGEKTDLEVEAPAGVPRAYGCRRWQLNQLPGNETVESQEDKRQELQKIHTEQRRRDWDWEKISELMEATYGTQRKEINLVSQVIEELQKAERLGREPRIPAGANVDDCHVSNVTARWPFLLQYKMSSLHFRILTEHDIVKNLTDFADKFSGDIMTFFLGYQKKKKEMRKLNKLLEKYMTEENKVSLTLLTTILMISTYFSEDNGTMFSSVEVKKLILPFLNFNYRNYCKSHSHLSLLISRRVQLSITLLRNMIWITWVKPQ